jgi:hypothetical protein
VGLHVDGSQEAEWRERQKEKKEIDITHDGVV